MKLDWNFQRGREGKEGQTKNLYLGMCIFSGKTRSTNYQGELFLKMYNVNPLYPKLSCTQFLCQKKARPVRNNFLKNCIEGCEKM